MQTFICYLTENREFGFIRGLQVLDDKRLGKQRVEAYQILTIIGRKQGWLPNPENKKGFWNHPAVRMWEYYIPALVDYTKQCCSIWTARGFKDSILKSIEELDKQFAYLRIQKEIRFSYRDPKWITPEFVRSHQSNLIRKFPEHYRPIFGDDVPDNLPYIWPV